MANTKTNKQQLQRKHTNTNNMAINKTLYLGLKLNRKLAK
jgi:hypothetical protein